MPENPYTGILGIMDDVAQTNKTPGACIGTITAPPPNIKISYKGIELTNKEVFIADYLLPGYVRHVQGETSYRGGGSGLPSYESHNHPVDNDETWTDTLKAGDHVAMIPVEASDDMQTSQQYYVLAKVVRPDWGWY